MQYHWVVTGDPCKTGSHIFNLRELTKGCSMWRVTSPSPRSLLVMQTDMAELLARRSLEFSRARMHFQRLRLGGYWELDAVPVILLICGDLPVHARGGEDGHFCRTPRTELT